MILFRAGNLHGAGTTPGAYSERASPVARMRAAELGMRRRVVAVDPAAEHRDGRPAGVKRAPVRLAVDPSGEAADDHQPGGGELAAEHPRDLSAVRRARASTDDPDSRTRENVQLRGASHEQACGRVVDRAQECRIALVRPAHPPNPLRLQPGEIAGLVERASEGPVGGVARLANEVCSTLGRKRSQRELSHVGPSSVGER